MTRWRVIPIALLLVASSAAVTAQRAAALFEQGLVQEHAAGHLDEAIALYLRAAQSAGTDRALAARARIRAGDAYEKLGRSREATDQYVEVTRSYPEQRTAVATAQARLTALRKRSPAVTKPAASVARDVPTVVTPVLERYCSQCHSAAVRTGDLDVVGVSAREVRGNTALWETVVRRLLARRDPPPGAPRPDDATYRSLIARLQQTLDAAYIARRPLTTPERATDTELATRLAAFLWKEPPDAPLLADAGSGRLHEPAVLDRQVVRMLRDPKSMSLVNGFFTGWLRLDNVKNARPDPTVYPQTDAELQQAMETETRLFLANQLQDDHDAVEIWTADYTYVNDRLARHYGLPGVGGKMFRRIAWPDPTRGGLLGQAGVLMALSQSSRTSPTQRGRFVLGHFLGLEAPNPPASVPPLPERPPVQGAMRERMQAHKVNPSCASCHAIFDPLGFALENFDATGAWRTTDNGFAIDASGTFIDGTRFDGPAGLRAGLLKYREAYYTNITTQLLAYALNRPGRAGRVYDYEMPSVRAIVRSAAAHDHRWSSILAGIAASEPFQMKSIIP